MPAIDFVKRGDGEPAFLNTTIAGSRDMSLSQVEIDTESRRFDTIVGIQMNVTTEFKNTTGDEFSRCLQSLYERCKNCIRFLGNYFKRHY
jgi:hypothetical protein